MHEDLCPVLQQVELGTELPRSVELPHILIHVCGVGVEITCIQCAVYPVSTSITKLTCASLQ